MAAVEISAQVARFDGWQDSGDMGIGDWLKGRDGAMSAGRLGIRSRRRRRSATSHSATAAELLEQRLYLSAAPNDGDDHAHDPHNVAHSLWYLPPGYSGALPEENLAEETPNHFVATGYKWVQTGGVGMPLTITYSYSNLLDGGLKGGLTAAQIRSAAEKAFSLWAAVTPLTFVEIVDSGPVVSDTSYAAGAYPKIRLGHEYIDGGSGSNILAHGYFPTGSGLAGDVHLDNGNTWKLGSSSGLDIIEVLTHEIGHSLGLDHEPASGSGGYNAIMNPFYGGRYSTGLNSAYLLQDDIDGIRTIYGTGIGSVVPIVGSGPGVTGAGDDHGNSASTSTVITVGTGMAGAIEAAADQDWFRFQAVAGLTYTFQTGLGSLPDSLIRLYNTNGITVLRNNDNFTGLGNASRIDWTATTSGTYYVSVQGVQSSQLGTYTLSASARNVAPVLGTIGNQTMSYKQDTLSIPLSATDLNGDTLTYSARIITNAAPLADVAYQLDQQHGLYATPDFLANNYYLNARASGEKYLRGNNNSWYLIFANGELYRWHTSMQDLEMIRILNSTFYNDPSLLWNAQSVSGPSITVTVNGSTLTVNPPANFVGRFEVEVTVTDGALSDSKRFFVDALNRPVTLSPIVDQAMSHTADKIEIQLAGSDPDGDLLTYSAQIVDSPANFHQLDTSLGLYVTADFLTHDYYFNARGASEKYLMGNDGAWYLLYANGKLFRWGTSLADCTFVSQLEPACFENPSLIWNSQPAAVISQVSTSIAGDKLTVNPPQGFAGAFQIRVSVTDGTSVASEVFTLDVANIAPVLAPIGDKAMSRTQNTIEIELSATDADNDALTYSVQISGGNEAYQLDQTYGFFVTADFLTNDYYVNSRGAGEKYLMGTGGKWFLLYGDGKVYEWGTSLADSTLIAQLDPQFYVNPELLWNALPGAADSIDADIIGDTLVVNPPQGYAGTFQVTVTVTDGASSDSETFSIQVANVAPVLANITSKTMPTSQNLLNINLSANDADGDTVGYSVSLEAGNPAWQLDQQYGFFVTPDFLERDYYLNARGAHEKYLMGNNGAWFLVREGGQVFLWNTTVANSTLLATLGDAFYDDPSLIWDAQPRGVDIAQASISGSTLTIDPMAGYTGTFNVTVTASDGQGTDSQTFTVTVTANLSSDDLAASGANKLYLNFDGANLTYEKLVRWAGDDWTDVLNQQLDPEADGVSVQAFWSDWSERDAFVEQVVANAQAQLAAFGIEVVRHTSDAVEGIGATTIFIGDVVIPGDYESWLGLASDVDDGNDNETDIGFVLPFYIEDDFDASARALANLILHEAGHTWGLEHVETNGESDLMGLGHDAFQLTDLARLDAAFMDREFLVHDAGSRSESQNSYRRLRSLFPAPS